MTECNHSLQTLLSLLLACNMLGLLACPMVLPVGGWGPCIKGRGLYLLCIRTLAFWHTPDGRAPTGRPACCPHLLQVLGLLWIGGAGGARCTCCCVCLITRLACTRAHKRQGLVRPRTALPCLYGRAPQQARVRAAVRGRT